MNNRADWYEDQPKVTPVKKTYDMSYAMITYTDDYDLLGQQLEGMGYEPIYMYTAVVVECGPDLASQLIVRNRIHDIMADMKRLKAKRKRT